MNDDVRSELYALIQKLDAYIAREERLENAIEANRNAIEVNRNAIAENRKAIEKNRDAIEQNGRAIARLEGKIAGSIIIIGLAAGLLGPLVMVIVNLVSK